MIKKVSLIFIACILVFIRTPVSTGARTAYIQNCDFEKTRNGSPVAWALSDGAMYISTPSGDEVAECVYNGDFELVNETFADGWELYRASYITISDTFAFDESRYSVRIRGVNSGTAYPCIMQFIDDIIPGAIYHLSCYVYLEGETITGAGELSLSYVREDGSFISTERAGSITDAGKWKKIENTFVIPEDCKRVRVAICNTNQGGYLYADDVSLKIAGAPERYRFETEEIFFYSDMETGHASVEANAYFTEIPFAKTDFEITYGEQVVYAKTGVQFKERCANLEFPLSILENERKEYILTAKVWENETVIEEFRQEIYKYPRPKALSKEGIYKINDNTFNPVIGYHVNKSEYETVKAGGINVVQVASGTVDGIKRILDELAQQELMGLVCLYANGMLPAGHPDNRAFTKQAVQALQGHSALFGWAIMDEPLQKDNFSYMSELLFDSYKIIRDIDSVHPTYICQSPPVYYRQAAKFCDILACDPYPYGRDSQSVTTYTERAVASVNSGKPVYSILQTYESTGNYLPSGDAVREQVYRAVMSGAKGIGFYSISDAVGHLTGTTDTLLKTDTWTSMCAFADSELEMLFDIYIHQIYTVFNKYREENGVRKELYADGKGGLFLILQNKANEERNVEIPLESANGMSAMGSFTAKPMGESGRAVTGNRTMYITLNAQQAIMYSITGSVSLSETAACAEAVSTMSLQPVKTENNGYVALPEKNAVVSQKVYGLTPHASYRLSFWYKGSIKNSAVLQIAYYTKNENGFTDLITHCTLNAIPSIPKEAVYSENFGAEAAEGGEWRQVFFEFYTPLGANALLLSVKAALNDPYLCVDDFEMTALPTFSLVRNGGFDSFKDTGVLSGGWSAYESYPAAYGNTVIFPNTDESNANWYLTMSESPQGEGKPSANARQTIYLYKDVTYSLSFRHKNTADVPCEIGLYADGVNGNEMKLTLRAQPNEWAQYRVLFTPALTGAYTLWLGSKTAKGFYSFEDVVINPYKVQDGMIVFYEPCDEKTAGNGAVNSILYTVDSLCASERERFLHAKVLGNETPGTLYVGLYAGKELITLSVADISNISVLQLPQKMTGLHAKAFFWSDNNQPKSMAVLR